MLKEEVVAYVKVLSHYRPGGNEENMKSCQDSQSPGPDSNPGSQEYRAEVPITLPLYRDVRSFQFLVIVYTTGPRTGIGPRQRFAGSRNLATKVFSFLNC